MTPSCRIELLGHLRVARGHEVTAHFRTQKTGLLLAYLAYYHHRSHPREALMELLWPEHRLEAARTSLSVALSSLRRQLESPLAQGGMTLARSRGTLRESSSELMTVPETSSIILANQSCIQLNPSLITTDVADFDAALQAAAGAPTSSEKSEWLARAVELYDGELLPGYHEGWILQERQWLAERYFEALSQLVSHLEREEEYQRALQYAQRGIRADPLREEAHRDLIRLYASAGQPDAALRQYQKLDRLLQDELGATPTAATRALIRELDNPAAASANHGSAWSEHREKAAKAEPSWPGTAIRPRIEEQCSVRPQRIVILHHHNSKADERLARLLEKRLASEGHQVFLDRHLAAGIEWAREVEQEIRSADAVIPLLSAAAVQSETLSYEIQTVSEVAQEQQSRPRLLPVRMAHTEPLVEPLPLILDGLEHGLWQGPEDDECLVQWILSALQQTGSMSASGGAAGPHRYEPRLLPSVPSPLAVLSTPGPMGGVVPLDSPYYVARSTDEQFTAAIARQDSIVLVKGARQMGKTSLLARGLHQAREAGACVILTDFQLLDRADLSSVEQLFRTLAGWIIDQLDLDVSPEEIWKPHLSTSVNFDRFLRRQVLGKIECPVVWALDEADRLFPYEYSSQVFGLLRSWHNRRALDPGGPWSRLTLAIAYATEAHLFITDLNQSAFNVGTRLSLCDFTLEQVQDLNCRYGCPLRTSAEVIQFHELVNGHPYLVNRGLQEMVTHGLGISAFVAEADRDEGVLGDHLRRVLVSLARDPELCDVVRAVLGGEPCTSKEVFYRLRGAGVLTGEAAEEARPRCSLYQTYLARHLL